MSSSRRAPSVDWDALKAEATRIAGHAYVPYSHLPVGAAALTDEQIRFLIDGYTAGTIPDEQVSALLMAIVFRSLTPRELATWTAAMIESGERLDLSSIAKPTVDKHSTGGVGDKISLPLCPLV